VRGGSGWQGEDRGPDRNHAAESRDRADLSDHFEKRTHYQVLHVPDAFTIVLFSRTAKLAVC
jgi:hypothetical protein